MPAQPVDATQALNLSAPAEPRLYIHKTSDFMPEIEMSLDQRLDDLMPQARRGSPFTATKRDALRRKAGLPT
jgi:hypothetical protein